MTAVQPKPSAEQLGIDLTAQEWVRAGTGTGCAEISFPQAPGHARGDWVLIRVSGDPEERVLVFDRNEWDCFLDGARNGEFDDVVS